MNIYIINGLPESGKDTFVDFVSTFVTTKNISTIDWVKEFCYIEYGIVPTDKSLKNRAIWHREKMRHNNYIFKIICDQIYGLYYTDVCFIHCREAKNIEKFINYFNGSKSILIDRKSDNDVSNFGDSDVYNYKYDIIIDNNNGFDSLKNNVVKFMNDEKLFNKHRLIN